MDTNRVVEQLGRRLRLAAIGGGPGSFIGAVHRAAARLDDRYDLVGAALSSDPARSEAAAVGIGLLPERAYRSADELIDAEAAREDGADVVAIMTPNDTHAEYAIAALRHGFDVICDKPLANSLDDALATVQAVSQSDGLFSLTYNYTGYPMVRQARAMVADGQLGDIRLVQVEYVQGFNAATPAALPAGGPLPWRLDPAKSGPSLVLGDIGTHAHHLLCYITGIEVAEVSAEVGATVPGQPVDDYAGVMLRLANGARGCIWATQAAAGMESHLATRVSGSEGTVEWDHDDPNSLRYLPIEGPAQTLTRGGPGNLPLAVRSTRVVKGHPEGFYEAFANIYTDVADAVAARRSGQAVDPLALHFPTVEDGARGVGFVEAAVSSARTGGAWTDCTTTF